MTAEYCSNYLPKVGDVPQAGEFRWHSGGQTESVVLDVHARRPGGDFALVRGRRHEHQVLYVVAQIVGDFDLRCAETGVEVICLRRRESTSNVGTNLPLDEALPRVEGQHDDDVLAQDGNRVRLLVQREAGLAAEIVLQRQRRLRLAILVAVFGVAVQLQVQAVWRDGN